MKWPSEESLAGAFENTVDLLRKKPCYFRLLAYPAGEPEESR